MHQFRVHDSLDDIPAHQWDALHDGANPMLSHAFLAGMERTGCLRPRWGWTPCHVTLRDGERLIAAAPGYRKDNSHGEFVFDHAWASAYAHYGRDYYPKWLFGVPYSPVAGPRLLGPDTASRAKLAQEIVHHCARLGYSSAHINFLPGQDAQALDPDAWLARSDIQFHWSNPGWRDLQDFLDSMVHKRRKAIRQEREKVARQGFEFRIVEGADASAEQLEQMHGFYCSTFEEKGNSPALTLEFFRHLASAMPRCLLLILAERSGVAIAGAMFLRGGDTLYGRYWGTREAASGLHFETCYYQGIEYCLARGVSRFEPGAQGEHKLARGFLPVMTHSRHYIADPDFARALAPWCDEERAATLRYRDYLLQHSPFRDDTATAAARG